MSSSFLHSLKAKLPHTWGAFLGRFGRFTEIQKLAIEPILAGKNCLLIASTASGKTEAALMPLIERLKQQTAALHAFDVLYVTPTRALTRDLAKRLQAPLEQLAITMAIKTGDEPALDARRPPNLLLTTPESLDSLLANRPRLLKDTRAVILDEIHLYDNTARGDGLRVLLNRLRRLRRYAHGRGDSPTDNLQFCALSATVGNPQAVAARYFADPLVIQAAGQRPLDVELLEMQGEESLRDLFAGLRKRGVKKALAFCNARSECEALAQVFKHRAPFGDNVFVHHASLDARLRHQTERHFAEASAALCFATSTLELGIDIGDVDLVILIGAPDDASAFLQRIGRGNRRSSRSAVVGFYRSPIEAAMFRVFIRAASMGELHAKDYFFRPSVIVQQLCSYIKQVRHGELVPREVYELFATPTGEPLISKAAFDDILSALIDKNYFVRLPDGNLRPGAVWQRLYEQREIYANLSDATRQSMEVVDEITGRKLGEMEWGTGINQSFLFGGVARRAVRRQGRKLIVRASEDDAPPPRFFTPRRALSPRLASAVAAELGLPQSPAPAEIAVVKDPELSEAQAWVFHCAGEAYAYLLGDLLENWCNAQVSEVNGFCFLLTGELPDAALPINAEQVQRRLRRRWQQFESYYDMGRFQKELPLEVRRASVEAAFDIENFLRAFAGKKLTQSATCDKQ
ncbi:MAG: DEAD/DEAH box helicase [Acidobacteriota bacterium]